MLLIPAIGEKPKKPRSTKGRWNENSRKRYAYRYQNDKEFRKYRCALARNAYYRRKEAMKAEASQ